LINKDPQRASRVLCKKARIAAIEDTTQHRDRKRRTLEVPRESVWDRASRYFVEFVRELVFI
jgi:hypothetical protein